jgi:hypothetical protein
MGMSQAAILALFFGRDDIPYQATWLGAGCATRSYVGFHQMTNEQECAASLAESISRSTNLPDNRQGVTSPIMCF